MYLELLILVSLLPPHDVLLVILMEEDAKMTWEIWFESTKHEHLQQSCKVPTIWVVSHMDIFLPPSYVEVYITRLRCNGGAAEHNINNNKNNSHMHHKAYRQKIELIFSSEQF